MRYSLEPKYRKYVQGYVFLSFARKFGDKYGKKLMDTATRTGINAAKKLGDKYGKNLMDTAKKQKNKTGLDAAKTASKRIVEKATQATGDLMRNKIAGKITSVGKSKNKEKENQVNEVKEIYIPPEKR